MSDERINSNATDSNDEVLQWVTYRLGDETYGINVMQVQEVLRYTEIAPVPGAPDYVLGIINLRGNVVTVIDTRAHRELGLSRYNAILLVLALR
jgi:purine-binding chemotaxis protein CheW